MALRAGVLGLLVLSLCRPALILSTAVPQQSFVGVLIDDSLSMQIADREGAKTRADFVQTAFGSSDSPLRASLEARFKLRFLSFAQTADRIPEVDALNFEGQQTDLSMALDRARQELGSLPLAGLVVVSDGAHNTERGPTEALLGLRAAGPRYAQRGAHEQKYCDARNSHEHGRTD